MRRVIISFALCFALVLTLQTGIVAAVQNDLNTGNDAGDNTTWAAQFNIPKSGTGYVDASDTVDFYKFTNAKYDRITAEVTPSGYFTVKIYDVSENLVASGTGSVNHTDLSGGYNYVAVERLSAAYTDYTLTISSSETIVDGTDNDDSAPAHNDMGTGADAADGDAISYAPVITAGSGTGYLDNLDVYDYYRVNVSNGQTITISATAPLAADIQIQILDTDLSGSSKSIASGQTDTLSRTATYSGYYYILVMRAGASGSGNYSLTLSVSSAVDTTDMGSGGDAGNSNGTAVTVSTGSGTGFMNASDTTDVFKIYVESGQKVSATLTPSSGSDFNLYLYEDSVTRSTSSLGAGLSDNVSDTAVLSGYRYIWVTYVSGSGNYTLSVAFENAAATTTPTATTTAAVSVSNISDNVGGTITVSENGLSSITVQSTTAIALNFETVQPVKTITVTTNASIENVSVQAEKLSSKPSAVSEPTSVISGVTVSHYLDITVTPTGENAVSVETADIEFKVEKSWLTANNIDPTSVKLLRYSTTWTELTTTAGSEDATYKYYTATTPGFSTFAVVGTVLPTQPGGPAPPLEVIVVVSLVMVVVILVIVWRYLSSTKAKATQQQA